MEVIPIGFQVGPTCSSLNSITFEFRFIHLFNTRYLIYVRVKRIRNLLSLGGEGEGTSLLYLYIRALNAKSGEGVQIAFSS